MRGSRHFVELGNTEGQQRVLVLSWLWALSPAVTKIGGKTSPDLRNSRAWAMLKAFRNPSTHYFYAWESYVGSDVVSSSITPRRCLWALGQARGGWGMQILSLYIRKALHSDKASLIFRYPSMQIAAYQRAALFWKLWCELRGAVSCALSWQERSCAWISQHGPFNLRLKLYRAYLQVQSGMQGLQIQALPRQVLISAEQIQLQKSQKRVARSKSVLPSPSPPTA